MRIRIASDDWMPIYIQIINQVNRLVASGRLAPGDELPSVRVLAGQLTVNRNTVARAYLELEREGVVHKRHGSGTYVSDAGSPLARKERLKILSERVDALLAEARNLNVEPLELLKVIKERSQSIQPKENK